MGALIGALILLFGGFAFGRTAGRARQSAWAGPRTTGMRQRASHGAGSGSGGHRSVRQEIRVLREKAHLDNWLKQQDHERTNGTAAAAKGGTAAMTGTVLTPLKRAQQVFTRPPAPASANGTPPAAPAAPARAAGAPTPAPSPAPSPGGTTVASATGTPAAERLIEGLNQINAEAATGGLHVKHAAIKACVEGALRFSQMMTMMARQMSEPGANYGPEITEPLEQMAMHMQAGAMAGGESDANMSTLVNMTVGDLANSARRAPHHTELSENGSH